MKNRKQEQRLRIQWVTLTIHSCWELSRTFSKHQPKDSPKHCVPRAANSDAVKWKDLERLQVYGPMSHTCPRMTVSWPNTQQKLVGNMSLSTNLLKM